MLKIIQFTLLTIALEYNSIAATSISSWKPIASPATYIIHQSHPSLGSISHTSNSISTDDDTTGLTSIGGSGGGGGGGGGNSGGIGSGVVGGHRLHHHNHHHHHNGGGSTITGLLGHDNNNDDDYHGFKINDANDGRILTGLGEPVYGEEDACSVDKYAFDHEGTVQYHNKLPKMDQFTICFWMRFTNHSGDHTLLTYSVDGEPREIQLWIANSKGSSYISMAIHGQQVFRLNYPLKMRKWHHACSSWNGKTGEWQLWIKAERVGRGFHNRLVGHNIPAHGLLYTGGPSVTGHIADGLHFEFTILQIYKVALSAGKAHRDHKHHHVHHFNHDGVATTTTPAPRVRPSPLPMNPNLANGQIPTRVRINLANPPQQQPPQPQQLPSVQGVPSQLIGGSLPILTGQQATINTNFINGQFHTNSRLISQQLASGGFNRSPSSVAALFSPQSQFQIQANSLGGTQQQLQSSDGSSAIQFPTVSGGSTNSFNQNSNSPSSSSNTFGFSLNPNTNSGNRFIFKRDNEPSTSTMGRIIVKRDTEKLTARKVGQRSTGGTRSRTRTVTKAPIKTKRGLVMLNDGSLVDDALLENGYEFQGLAKFGQQSFKQGLETKMNLEDEIKEHDKEPAEEEVKAVMQICTSCDSEPFKGAIVFAWTDAKTHQEGTLKGRSVGGCGYF